MRAVITVIGHDTVGIISHFSALCAEENVNILDISQSVLKDFFAMIMLVDISGCKVDFSTFIDKAGEMGKLTGTSVHVQHEDIFNSMHKI